MNEPSKETIEQRVYELYLERGCEPGMEVEDWLAAEKELTFDGALSESKDFREPKAERHVPQRSSSPTMSHSAV